MYFIKEDYTKYLPKTVEVYETHLSIANKTDFC